MITIIHINEEGHNHKECTKSQKCMLSLHDRPLGGGGLWLGGIKGQLIEKCSVFQCNMFVILISW